MANWQVKPCSDPSWIVESKPFLEFIRSKPRTPAEISTFAREAHIPKYLVSNVISWCEINRKIIFKEDQWYFIRE